VSGRGLTQNPGPDFPGLNDLVEGERAGSGIGDSRGQQASSDDDHTLPFHRLLIYIVPGAQRLIGNVGRQNSPGADPDKIRQWLPTGIGGSYGLRSWRSTFTMQFHERPIGRLSDGWTDTR